METETILSKLKDLELKIKNGKIKIPIFGSKEWQEINKIDKLWGEKLKPILSGIEFTYLIEPSGGEGRTLDEEKALFFESLSDENSDYNPTFTYPNLENYDLDKKEKELSIIQNEIKEKNKLTNLQKIIIRLYQDKVEEELIKIKWLKAVREKDDEKSFQYSNNLFGRLEKKHIYLARQYLSLAEKVDDKVWQTGYKNLEEEIYEPKDIKEFFENVLQEYDLRDKWKVEITDEVSSITDQYKHINGPRMAIPINRPNVSVIKLLELSAHEIEAHALSDINGNMSGLMIISGAIQPDRTEEFEEGKALLREQLSLKEIFGKKFPNFDKSDIHPLYILAMGLVQKGYNFRKTFREMEKFRYKIELDKSGGDKNIAREKSRETAWTIARRIFRSISDLSSGGKFFSKDKAYLIGLAEVEKFEKASELSWLDIGKTNIRILPELLQMGIIPENIKYPFKNATKTVWERTLRSKHLAE
jgi:hypothetical protein